MSLNYTLHIESLIFAAPRPIPIDDIVSTLAEAFEVDVSVNEVEKAINEIVAKYNDPIHAIDIQEVSGGFTFMSKPAHHHVLAVYLKQTENRKLSKAALETLSIIAYKQPCTRTDIESIRGVNCDYAIQKLLEKDLVHIIGRNEGPGKPLIYGTSETFMNYFGLKTISDLPKLKEIKEEVQNVIGDEDSKEV